MERDLQKAVELIKAGNDPAARELLLNVLRANPKNDKAWVWMASITKERDKRQKCLEEALKHNPNNQIAKRALQKMTSPKKHKADNAPKQKLPILAHVLCGWPILLLFIGGAIGGALGGLAYGINIAIYRARIPILFKYILIPLVGFSAFGIWLIAGILITSL
jgi:hypothetical protein